MKTIGSNESRVMTFSDTKKDFSKVVDSVDRGREVLFRRRDRIYRIEVFPEPKPLPIYPVGYFDESFTDEEMELHKALMKDAPAKPYL